jgi:phage shock protein PspC (stress-responsive transcriptional regulator)
MTRTRKQLLVPVVLLQAGFFLFVSRHRFIDGDEGFYLLASRLVFDHKTPYLDFFYTQAPLLPYVYALWFKLTRLSWLSARTLAALQTTLLGGLIYAHVCRETQKWLAGVCAAILFASSSLIFAWFPIVKTFPLATPFLFLAYMILVLLAESSPGWWVAIAGLFFALSVDTRSYVLGVAPVFVWWIWRSSSHEKRETLRQAQDRRWGTRQRLARLLWAVLGFTIGSVPSLILFVASPDAFLFNNLGYHALRSHAGLIGDWLDKLHVVMATLGGRFTGFQFSVITLTCMGMLVTRRMKRDSALLAFGIAVVLGFVCILPTPASMQYFSMIVPFLIVAAVISVSDYLAALQTLHQIRIAKRICAVGMISFVAFGIPAFRQYLFTGYKVPGVLDPHDAPNWTLPQVTAVSNAIDTLARPGEQVISFWPGYLFAAQASPYPGFENDFGMYVARKLTAEQREKYHILTPAAMMEIFDDHRVRLIVIGNQGPWVGGPDYNAAVSVVGKSGYQPVRTVGSTAIFECCAEP